MYIDSISESLSMLQLLESTVTDVSLPQSIADKLGGNIPSYDGDSNNIYQVNRSSQDVEPFKTAWKNLTTDEKDLIGHYNGDNSDATSYNKKNAG